MATIRPDEITSIIKAKIENYASEMEVSNIGSVLEVGDGIARVYGLRNAMSNELVEFEDGKDNRKNCFCSGGRRTYRKNSQSDWQTG